MITTHANFQGQVGWEITCKLNLCASTRNKCGCWWNCHHQWEDAASCYASILRLPQNRCIATHEFNTHPAGRKNACQKKVWMMKTWFTRELMSSYIRSWRRKMKGIQVDCHLSSKKLKMSAEGKQNRSRMSSKIIWIQDKFHFINIPFNDVEPLGVRIAINKKSTLCAKQF